jgi:hypothetical protein
MKLLHRRWTFTLRTLLVVVAAAGMAAGWFALEFDLVRRRREALAAPGLTVRYFKVAGPGTSVPLTRRWLGDEAISLIFIAADSPADAERLRTLFPEAKVDSAAIGR